MNEIVMKLPLLHHKVDDHYTLLHEIASFNLCINYSWVKARKGDNHPEFQAQGTRALKCFLRHRLFQSLFAALPEPMGWRRQLQDTSGL